ncbi:hypothetical protein BC829DRAFT_156736 [Chytridium lagenaria]|nr:hypothetical protein BC829DRAFT_156736 [Chytridium lagenaria]
MISPRALSMFGICTGSSTPSPPQPHRSFWNVSTFGFFSKSVLPPVAAESNNTSSEEPEPMSPNPNIAIFDRAIYTIDGLRHNLSRDDEDFLDDDALTLMADVVAGIRSTTPYIMVRDLDSLRKAGASLTVAPYAAVISQLTSYETLSWASLPHGARDSALQVLDQTVEYFDFQDRSNTSAERRNSSPAKAKGGPNHSRVTPGHIKGLLKTLRQAIRDQSQVDVDELLELRTYADVPELRRRFWGLEQVMETLEGSLGKVFERFLEELSLRIEDLGLQASTSSAQSTTGAASASKRTEPWWSPF